ncbi:hypothetical protein AMTRI_Chr02g264510 [Amborella trichopoda]
MANLKAFIFFFVFHLSPLATSLKLTIQVSKGMNTLQTYIGNPPRYFLLVMDTGMDITWVQCTPCVNCITYIDGRSFDPTGSSSYRKIDCAEPTCRLVTADCSGTCAYSQYYFDSSYSHGDFGTDNFTLVSDTDHRPQFGPIYFGCGRDSHVSFDGPSGVIGLGRGPESLFSQLRLSVGPKFSYCLPQPQYLGSLVFGPHPKMNQSAVQTIPIPRSQDFPSQYILELWGITIGNIPILTSTPTPGGTIKQTDERMLMVIDTFSPLTYLRSDIHARLLQGLRDTIGSNFIEVSGHLPLCYNVTDDSDMARFPSVTFYFSGGAAWKVDPQNMFPWASPYKYCLVVAPVDGLGMFGSWAQVDKAVEYDVDTELISFAPADCQENSDLPPADYKENSH